MSSYRTSPPVCGQSRRLPEPPPLRAFAEWHFCRKYGYPSVSEFLAATENRRASLLAQVKAWEGATHE
jgi:hypothetical protein